MAAAGTGDMSALEQGIRQTVLEATKNVERQLDAEIERLDKLDEDELETLRNERIAHFKKQQKLKQEWMKQGHGEYSEIPEEKEFFEVTKKSSQVVCLFYTNTSERCRIVDKHLNILARKHVETKFCKINATKCPFLTDRLKIRVMPTMILVKDSKTKDYIVGFTELGNRDDFTTEILEWRLALSGLIDYDGDLTQPPEQPKAGQSAKPFRLGAQQKKKIIRGKDSDSGGDDSE